MRKCQHRSRLESTPTVIIVCRSQMRINHLKASAEGKLQFSIQTLPVDGCRVNRRWIRVNGRLFEIKFDGNFFSTIIVCYSSLCTLALMIQTLELTLIWSAPTHWPMKGEVKYQWHIRGRHLGFQVTNDAEKLSDNRKKMLISNHCTTTPAENTIWWQMLLQLFRLPSRNGNLWPMIGIDWFHNYCFGAAMSKWKGTKHDEGPLRGKRKRVGNVPLIYHLRDVPVTHIYGLLLRQLIKILFQATARVEEVSGAEKLWKESAARGQSR